MKFSKTLLAVTLAFGGIVSSAPGTIAAQGYNAVSTAALNVRSGPGTRFNIIDTLYRGEPVQTQECRANWCFVTHPGRDGWVSARYLRAVAHQPPSYTPPPAPPPPPGLSWPTQPAPTPPNDPWPGPSVPWPFEPWPGTPRTPTNPLSNPIPSEPEYQVCLFDGKNYTGRSVCVLSGRSFNQLGPRWNNRFSSLRVYPRASITLCRDANFSGFCRTFKFNIPEFGSRLNNSVSSLRVD